MVWLKKPSDKVEVMPALVPPRTAANSNGRKGLLSERGKRTNVFNPRANGASTAACNTRRAKFESG